MARQARAILHLAPTAATLCCAVSLLCVCAAVAQESAVTGTVLETIDPEAARGGDVPAGTRFEVSDEIQRLATEADYAAAAALGDEFLALSEQEFGAQSTSLADAYVQVADVESLNGEFEDAQEHALRAIEIYRDAEGPFTSGLIRPFVVLGDNYQRSGDHLNAVSAYGEARNVSRRVYGLLNDGQIPILDRMSESFLELQQFEEARALQLESVSLIERSFEPYSPEALGAIYKYARWLRNNRRFTEERDQYFRADRIIRDHYGEDSLPMVDVLRERANSFRIQGAEDPAGSNGLDNALEILDNQPEPDPFAYALLLRDIGDWQTAFNRADIDGEMYRRSWQLLGQVEGGEALREEWYGDIAIVLRAEVNRRGLSANPDDPEGHVTVSFTVDKSGRPRDLVIAESDPPGLKDEAVARSIRQSRYRPAIVDGELVQRRRALSVTFNYFPDD